jgi:hypothetical protein
MRQPFAAALYVRVVKIVLKTSAAFVVPILPLFAKSYSLISSGSRIHRGLIELVEIRVRGLGPRARLDEFWSAARQQHLRRRLSARSALAYRYVLNQRSTRWSASTR